ncbi:hypothetical protein LA6_001400 [Marinibacterium anthonyi]|nr:hypothetical protein LA6_001400 [Marinibacterium anthonyi]
MTRLIAFALAGILAAACVHAAEDPAPAPVPGAIVEAGDFTLDSFQWIARPIVVFADTPADPKFQQQIANLKADIPRLADRDVVVLTDTDPAAPGAIRSKLRPRGFQMVLVDKDGTVILRKPLPYSVREITRTIDKTTSRQEEVRERRAQGTEEISD